MLKLSEKKHLLNILFFLVPLFLLSVLNLFHANDSRISQLENRALKSKPVFSWEALFSGSYFQEYDDYFADTFVFRDSLVRLSGKIIKLRGPGSDEDGFIVLHQGANVFQQQHGSSGESAEKRRYAPGKILVLGDKAMEIHAFSPAAAQAYTGVLNSFAAKVGPEVKVYSLLAPTQIAFLNNKRYASLSSPQEATLNYVRENLNRQVTFLSAYKTLADHRDEYVYFRTDHHWTALGAYYAYQAFMESKGEAPVPLEKYEQTMVENYLGSTYRATLASQLEKNPDTIYIFQPFIEHEYYIYYEKDPVKSSLLDMQQTQKKNKYGVFLGGDTPLAQIVTQADQSKKILVVKDSYANAFIPFLLPHYQEIYVVDPRQYQGDVYRLIREQKIDEVLFLNYVLILDNEGFPELLAALADS